MSPHSPPARTGKGEALDVARLPKGEVLLNVYNLGETNAMRKVNAASSAIGGGVYHAGVEINGVEWSYGGTDDDGTGVSKCYPRCHPGHNYRETVRMGQTKVKEYEVKRMLTRLVDEWPGHEYHFLKHNCLDFASTVTQELGVGRIPGWVDRYGRTAEKLGNVFSGAKRTAQMFGKKPEDESLTSPIRRISFRTTGKAIDLRDADDISENSDDSSSRILHSRRFSKADTSEFSLRQPMSLEAQIAAFLPDVQVGTPVAVDGIPTVAKKATKSPPATQVASKSSTTKTKKATAQKKQGDSAQSQTSPPVSKASAKASAKATSKAASKTAAEAKDACPHPPEAKAPQRTRAQLLSVVHDTFDHDGDGHLKQHEMLHLLECAGAEIETTLWPDQYKDVCSEVGADPAAGVNKQQLKQCAKDITKKQLEALYTAEQARLTAQAKRAGAHGKAQKPQASKVASKALDEKTAEAKGVGLTKPDGAKESGRERRPPSAQQKGKDSMPRGQPAEHFEPLPPAPVEESRPLQGEVASAKSKSIIAKSGMNVVKQEANGLEKIRHDLEEAKSRLSKIKQEKEALDKKGQVLESSMSTALAADSCDGVGDSSPQRDGPGGIAPQHVSHASGGGSFREEMRKARERTHLVNEGNADVIDTSTTPNSDQDDRRALEEGDEAGTVDETSTSTPSQNICELAGSSCAKQVAALRLNDLSNIVVSEMGIVSM